MDALQLRCFFCFRTVRADQSCNLLYGVMSMMTPEMYARRLTKTGSLERRRQGTMFEPIVPVAPTMATFITSGMLMFSRSADLP